MRWIVGTDEPAAAAVDLLVVGLPQRGGRPDLRGLESLDRVVRGGLAALRDGAVFCARAESKALLPGRAGGPRWVLALGLGLADDLSPQLLRRCAGVAAAQARAQQARRCAVLLSDRARGSLDSATAARCWVEGAELALGEIEKPDPRGGRSRPPERAGWPESWRFLVRAPGARGAAGARAAVRRALAEGEAYAEGCLLARRLVNLPANILTPIRLAQEARRIARRAGCRFRALGPAEIARLGMGGLLGVARGSVEEPRLIVIESRPSGAGRSPRRAPLVALVGKGLTFDSGGISIKAAARMEQMKSDMGGAAAVLGAVLTLARLAVPVRLLVVIPATENMPDGAALKPGDVVALASGKTVEVVNTDAEGRLVVADALHYACTRRPDWLIDAATLTGACVVALGPQFAGVMGNDSRLIDALDRAGAETFERVWPLPLVEEHHKAIKGDIADLKNTGPREGGALTAAAFLATAVDDAIPWAHVDLAGPVWTDTAGPLGPKGATGYGARLLARAVHLLVS
jgi:leucyl aminopeptidase